MTEQNMIVFQYPAVLDIHQWGGIRSHFHTCVLPYRMAGSSICAKHQQQQLAPFVGKSSKAIQGGFWMLGGKLSRLGARLQAPDLTETAGSNPSRVSSDAVMIL